MSARKYNPLTPVLFLSGGSALLAVGVIFQGRLPSSRWPWAEYVIFGAAYLLAGWNVLVAAVRSIGRGRVFDENFLMSLATAGAFAVHQLWEAVAVMVLYKVGEILEDLSADRSRRSISKLLALRAAAARVRRGGVLIEVKPEQVAVGEEVLVRPGERVPLDGVVLAGAGFVNTSALTGEPMPRRVEPGMEVLAGFISSDGSLSIRATKSAGESSAAKIISLVESATQSKAKTERFIRSFAKVYTPLVVAAAVLVAFVPPLVLPGASMHDWVYRALTMLVISCPCALVISVPLGYIGGVGGMSRHGVLVKGATFLDALARVRTVVFDKTGTMTKGAFKVTSVNPRNGLSGPLLLRYAALAEAHSNHPIAASVKEAYAREAGAGSISDVAVTMYREVGGQGVTAQVEGHYVTAGNDRLLHQLEISHDTCCIDGTAVHVAVDGMYAGYLVIGDETRDDAARAVKDLRAIGVGHIALLTGDGSDVAQRVAAELGIDDWHGDLLPAEKVSHLEQIMSDHGGRGATAFIGDGINDAPVLARADVGIAMGGTGADAAVETADVVIMTDSPEKVVEAIRRGRHTRAIVLQNIVFALGVKGVFLALAAFGVATMWEAVIADMGVALAAILNAARAVR
jgi:Cd2+/Zn2+-exporting ATPase